MLHRALGSRDRCRPQGEAELPEQVSPLHAEAVARPTLDERDEAILRELCPPGKIADVPEGPVRLALGDESRSVILSDRLQVREADPHGLRALC